MPLEKALLDILVCPQCHGPVEERHTPEGPGLACTACKLLFPIVNDIPNFLVEEARPLTK
jgi:uncharacterized protein YbaR (Trm112 family)